MSSARAKEDHPAIKGPSALRSILAGSTAGAVEIGECGQSCETLISR
jgi:solute carrier family 25 citrate transporter 1